MTTTAEKSGLTELFLRLGEDRSLLAEYERDPRRLLLEAGLAEDEIAAVLDGDSRDVRLFLEDEITRDPERRRVLTPTLMTSPFTPDDDDDQGDDGGGDDQGDDDDQGGGHGHGHG